MDGYITAKPNIYAAVVRSFVSPYSTLKVGSYKVARWLGAGFNASVVTPADVEKGQDTVQKVRSSWAVAYGPSWLPAVVWRLQRTPPAHAGSR